MPNAKRLTVEINDLPATIVALRDDKEKLYNRFMLKIFTKNKKFVEMSAWHFTPQPEKEETPK